MSELGIYDRAIGARACYNRGISYKLTGKTKEAIADFYKFLTLTDDAGLIQKVNQQIVELSNK